MSTQYIIRKGTFDSGHRVMNERLKCFNMHGHTYLYELEFAFDTIMDIGYAIDFKEIKRIGCQWIDDLLDHGFIVNPCDIDVIASCKATKSKTWYMALNGEGEYCNPSVENIAKEIFLAMEILFRSYTDLKINKVILHETPNCYTVCTDSSVTKRERQHWTETNEESILAYAAALGVMEYDDRKL